MPPESRTRNPLVAVFIGLIVVVAVGGLLLALTGVGAELSESRELRLTIYAVELLPEVAAMVEVGDPVYTDPGGMEVGEIVDVTRGPSIMPVPDFQGTIHAAEDPTQDEVSVVIAARGREGNGIVAIDNQVIQAGMQFNVVTDRYVLKGVVTGVEFD